METLKQNLEELRHMNDMLKVSIRVCTNINDISLALLKNIQNLILT